MGFANDNFQEGPAVDDLRGLQAMPVAEPIYTSKYGIQKFTLISSRFFYMVQS